QPRACALAKLVSTCKTAPCLRRPEFRHPTPIHAPHIANTTSRTAPLEARQTHGMFCSAPPRSGGDETKPAAERERPSPAPSADRIDARRRRTLARTLLLE